jgi:tRNA A58 N-methylase Trm61
MKTITLQINEETGLPPLPEPTNANYSMYNTGGVECEVGEFLYGLVRMMKPELILETGTHRGIGAAYLGEALRANDHGKLITLEFIEELWRISALLINQLGLDHFVTPILADVTTYNLEESVDILFLDTEPNLRFAELIRFWDKLKPGGIVIIHDLSPQMGQSGITINGMTDWPFGTLPDEIKELIKTKQLQSLHFSTPRGLFVAQKIREDFYTNKI